MNYWKIILVLFIAAFVIGGIVAAFFTNFSQPKTTPPTATSSPFGQPAQNTSAATSPSVAASQPIPDQSASAGTHPVLANAYLTHYAQYAQPTKVTLRGTAIASDYALQSWTDGDQGGEALFKYDAASKAWVELSGGGGAWDVASLVSLEKVPESIAEKLVAEISK